VPACRPRASCRPPQLPALTGIATPTAVRSSAPLADHALVTLHALTPGAPTVPGSGPWVLRRERRWVGPKYASWPMHSCGNTATKGLGQLGGFRTCGTRRRWHMRSPRRWLDWR
jgi:hypothetical protein